MNPQRIWGRCPFNPNCELVFGEMESILCTGFDLDSCLLTKHNCSQLIFKLLVTSTICDIKQVFKQQIFVE